MMKDLKKSYLFQSQIVLVIFVVRIIYLYIYYYYYIQIGPTPAIFFKPIQLFFYKYSINKVYFITSDKEYYYIYIIYYKIVSYLPTVIILKRE